MTNSTTHHPSELPTDASTTQTNQRRHQTTRRANPSRQHVNGVIPESVSFGASLPMKTPVKMSQLVNAGKGSTKITNMIHQCTGMPMKACPTFYGKCAKCKSKTAWYCPGCKRWLCIERRALKENNKQFKLYSHEVRGKKKTFLKMCFHEVHHRRKLYVLAVSRFGQEIPLFLFLTVSF